MIGVIAMAGALILGFALLRLALWVVVTLVRIVVFLLFAPLFGRRHRQPRVYVDRAPRRAARRYGNESALMEALEDLVSRRRVYPPPPRRRSRRVEEEEYYDYQPRRRPERPIERVPTRDEMDCERALVQLGFHKLRAKEITQRVLRDIGEDAGLDEMVKHGLQLAGGK